MVLVVGLAGCGSLAGADASSTSSQTQQSSAVTAQAAVAETTGSLWDTSVVHTVSVDVDADALSTMLSTYLSSGTKKWLTASVTIDGVTYENVGIKLKGNSILKGVAADTDAATLPWRIRLDKYVDGQNASGVTDFTVRTNTSATSLNEAVALDALDAAGLATEQSAATRFSVNGGTEELRLSVQALNDAWVEENFPDAGADSVLYKATADGSWGWLAPTATTATRSTSRRATTTTPRSSRCSTSSTTAPPTRSPRSCPGCSMSTRSRRISPSKI